MGGLVWKHPGLAFGNQQQGDVVPVQQLLVYLAREIVGERHRDGTNIDQRQVMHQPHAIFLADRHQLLKLAARRA